MTTIRFHASRLEKDWVIHAANLRGLSMADYIKEAVNVRLQREGVDAVLFNIEQETVNDK